MNSTVPSEPAFRFRIWYLLPVAALCLPLACVIGVTSYFRLSSETKALRRTVMGSVGGQWNTKVAVNIGGFTMGLVRVGSHLLNLPPEARAAIDTLHGAEVGVYRLPEEQTPLEAPAIFPAADKVMELRGWERVVGVVQGRDWVGVYIPRQGISPQRIRCCVAVLHEGNLVVASVRGNPEPLLELATKQLHSQTGWAHHWDHRQEIVASVSQ